VPRSPTVDIQELVDRYRPLLARGMDQGIRRYGSVPMDPDDYATGVVRRVLGSLRRGQVGASRFGEALEGRALGDLYLAMACDLGFPEAWKVFEDRFGPRIRGWAARLMRDEAAGLEMARDLIGDLAGPSRTGREETLLGEFNGQASLAGWLRTIIGNRAFDLLRRRARFPAVQLRPDGSYRVGEAPNGTEDALLSRDLKAALDRARSRMTEREALALYLTYQEELKLREIAPRLGVSISRTAKLRRNAVKKIQEECSRTGHTGRWSVLRDAIQEWLEEMPSSEGLLPPEESAD